jgi:hypothetical protein
MGKTNVLIIDGNEAMQQLRARVLRSHGVHVHTAKGVTEPELLWVPDFFDLVLLTCARDPKKQLSSGERFGASIQDSRSGSWSDSQRTRLPPASTRSLPAARFLKTGCRGQESYMSHKAVKTPIAASGDNKSRRKFHETGAFDQ